MAEMNRKEQEWSKRMGMVRNLRHPSLVAVRIRYQAPYSPSIGFPRALCSQRIDVGCQQGRQIGVGRHLECGTALTTSSHPLSGGSRRRSVRKWKMRLTGPPDPRLSTSAG